MRYRLPVKWIHLLFTRTFLGCLLRALKGNRKSFLCCFFFKRGVWENFQIFIRNHPSNLNYCNSHLESLLHSLMWILSWMENLISWPAKQALSGRETRWAERKEDNFPYLFTRQSRAFKKKNQKISCIPVGKKTLEVRQIRYPAVAPQPNNTDLLKPIAKIQQSLLKDTTDFLNFAEKTKVAKDTILVSMDVTSLYTNIPQGKESKLYVEHTRHSMERSFRFQLTSSEKC